MCYVSDPFLIVTGQVLGYTRTGRGEIHGKS